MFRTYKNNHGDLMVNNIVLLFSLPRSGSTWVGKMLDSHSSTLYLHEPDTWVRLGRLPILLYEENMIKKYREEAITYCKQLPYFQQPNIYLKRPFFKKSYQSRFRAYGHRLSVIVAGLFMQFFPKIKPVPIVKPFSRSQMNDVTLIWKSIESLGRLKLILDVLPYSRAVHLIRHPCGFIASVLFGEKKNKFSNPIYMSKDWGIYEHMIATPYASKYGLSMEKLRRESEESRLAWRWLIFNELALEAKKKFAERVLIVSYDKICQHPAKEMEKIFQFCGLEWAKQSADFINKSVSQNNDSYYGIYKNPRESSNKWKKLLTRKQIENVFKVLRKNKEIMGLISDF